MRNKGIDLNNHLFEELERLNDEDLTGSALDEEIRRARAMSCIAERIIGNASLALKAAEFEVEMCGTDAVRLPPLLDGSDA